MHRLRTSAALLGLSAVALAGAATTAGAGDRPEPANQSSAVGRQVGNPFTLAVIGDIPYGKPQEAVFPSRIDELNADPDVQLVVHVGDIKTGSSKCTATHRDMVRAQFDRLEDAVVYTPGDNEWTDCHRAGDDPLAMLTALRQTFFPVPDQTLGQHPIAVASQAEEGYVENVTFERSGVAFAAVHVVGSNNSMVPWSGLRLTAPTPEQTAEVLGRTGAVIDLIRESFGTARRNHDRAVVLLTQADMFDETFSPTFAQTFAFKPIAQAIVDEASRFDGPVYLINGDSHVYRKDAPLATGSKWLDHYGLRGAADNLTRITIEGSDVAEGSSGVDEWLKVRTTPVNDPRAVASERVTFVNQAAG